MAPAEYAYRTDPEHLDLSFYTLYDPYFLVSKAVALHSLIHRPDLLAGVVTKEDQSQLGFELDRPFFDRLRAELYFTELHQVEGMLALLVALFQGLPDWIFLTDYLPGDMKDNASKLVSGDASGLSRGKCATMSDFAELAVYGPLRPTADDLKEVWPANIENLVRFIQHQAQRYLDGLPAYNAFKHGLRLAAGPGSIRAGPDGGPMSLVAGSQNTLTYLERHKLEKGLYGLRHVMREFRPEASMAYLRVMAHVLEAIKTSRLLFLHQEVERYVLFLNLTDEWIRHQEGPTPFSSRWSL